MEDKEREQLQSQIAALTQQLADTQAALNKAQTANRRLMQDNQSLRYKLQDWGSGINPKQDPRIKGTAKE